MICVLYVFSVDVMKDYCFQKVFIEYKKLLEGDIVDMILFYIDLLLVLVRWVVDVVDIDMIVILKEF